MSGQIVHFELPADDTANSREFWGSLFGWQFETAELPFEYHVTQLSDQTGAAITNMEAGKRGARVYFDVEDIDAGAARVRELGGEASERRPVPGMGWVAICIDPTGNEFGLWQQVSTAIGFSPLAAIGSPHWRPCFLPGGGHESPHRQDFGWVRSAA